MVTEIDVPLPSFEFEILKGLMALAEQFHIPPGTLLCHILGAVIRHIVPAVHRLDLGNDRNAQTTSAKSPDAIYFYSRTKAHERENHSGWDFVQARRNTTRPTFPVS
jgi:hypothetical protein